METFSADWLALREAYDRTARSQHLARAFLGALPRRPLIADLGCGRGSNAAYLSALGRRDLRWLLVDGDEDLLTEARLRCPNAQRLRADLGQRAVLAALDRCEAITASALCDLVSRHWIDTLIRRAARRALPVFLALTVDGRIRLSPAHPYDSLVLAAFRRDQRRDKGFGPALGAAAVPAMLAAMRRYGYRQVRAARSDWRLTREDGAMLTETLAGIAAVAGEPGKPWMDERRSQIDAAVGHADILALP
jgi:SAM-dependent methyltransferase